MSDDLINQLRAECASKHPTLGSVVLSVPDARRLLAMAERGAWLRLVRKAESAKVVQYGAYAWVSSPSFPTCLVDYELDDDGCVVETPELRAALESALAPKEPSDG